jgi:hypothetical protein
VNYLAVDVFPPEQTSQHRKKFKADVKHYFWEEPYMFKVEINEIFRRCISSEEVSNILFQCHSFIYGGQSLPIWDFLPIIFMDARAFVLECDKCQRTYNITKRNEMPLRPILEVKIFNIWGIDFMGPFPSSKGNEYILVAIDSCMSKG